MREPNYIPLSEAGKSMFSFVDEPSLDKMFAICFLHKGVLCQELCSHENRSRAGSFPLDRVKSLKR